jgi:hypothetical protein
MLKYCLGGEKKSKLFTCLSLLRLPKELRNLSTRKHLSDMKSLAAKSDRLTPNTVNAIAATTRELHHEEDNVPIVVLRGHQTRRVAVCSVAMELPREAKIAGASW